MRRFCGQVGLLAIFKLRSQLMADHLRTKQEDVAIGCFLVAWENLPALTS